MQATSTWAACVKAPDHWLLALVAHHAILDLYSTHQVTQQLLAAYTHSLRAACMDPVPVQRGDEQHEVDGCDRSTHTGTGILSKDTSG